MLIDIPHPSRPGHLGGRRRRVPAGALDAREQGSVGIRPVPERAEDLSGAAAGPPTGHVCVAQDRLGVQVDRKQRRGGRICGITEDGD